MADTGERIGSSSRGRMLAAGALAAAAAGAAVARHRQTSDGSGKPRRDGVDDRAEQGRGGPGVAHRALETLSDFASQIASAVMPNGSDQVRRERHREAIRADQPPPFKSERARRQRSRELREEFDRSWDA